MMGEWNDVQGKPRLSGGPAVNAALGLAVQM